MLNAVRTFANSGPKEFAVVRLHPTCDREVVERRFREPPEPDNWFAQADVSPGKFACQGYDDGQFGEAEWVRELGVLELKDEVEDLEREKRELVEVAREMLELLRVTRRLHETTDADTPVIDVPDVDLGGSDL